MSLEQDNDLKGYKIELESLKDSVKIDEKQFNKNILEKLLEYDNINKILNSKNTKIKQNQMKKYKLKLQQIKNEQDFDDNYKKFCVFNKNMKKLILLKNQ